MMKLARFPEREEQGERHVKKIHLFDLVFVMLCLDRRVLSLRTGGT